jgi:oxygen-independent coproporphyrinogen-3 oxidase
VNQLPSAGGAGDGGSSDRSFFGADFKEVSQEPVAVYVHIPFCPSKCGYCDFNSYAMEGDIVERTENAIRNEILRSPHQRRPAKTIFFGGGTPTFLKQELLLPILEAVLEVHPPVEGAEITSEANPGTADAIKFRAMRQAGFNRLSLGAQSFQDEELLRLGRVHSASEIERAFQIAREEGFENINLDLMFALPGQSRFVWQNNLRKALELSPEHLSLYCLTIEENTKFYKKHLRGQLDLPDEDEQVEMYDLACRVAADSGYAQYEISNFSKPGRECLHNLCYWRCEEYAGYGPGAVGRVGRTRYTNLKHPARYAEAVERSEPLWCESEDLDEATLRTERIMLGLRLNEGLALEDLELDERAVADIRRKQWIEADRSRLRLTSQGRHWCSEAALALL